MRQGVGRAGGHRGGEHVAGPQAWQRPLGEHRRSRGAIKDLEPRRLVDQRRARRGEAAPCQVDRCAHAMESGADERRAGKGQSLVGEAERRPGCAGEAGRNGGLRAAPAPFGWLPREARGTSESPRGCGVTPTGRLGDRDRIESIGRVGVEAHHCRRTVPSSCLVHCLGRGAFGQHLVRSTPLSGSRRGMQRPARGDGRTGCRSDPLESDPHPPPRRGPSNERRSASRAGPSTSARASRPAAATMRSARRVGSGRTSIAPANSSACRRRRVWKG